MSNETTLEWFGATTFRLRTHGVTIFLDTWLDKPDIMPSHLAVQDVTEADYIFISHAHFDHLPGADRIALKTGAIVIANGEAINCLREAGVPHDQLIPVAGGERIPLFTKEVRDKARVDASVRAPGPPGGPAFPLASLAALSVHVWPSLHCLMPEGHPQEIDTGTVYTGSATPYTCTVDITFGMKHGLLRIGDLLPEDQQTPGHKSFIKFVNDRKTNVFSHYDGGQLMFNFILPSSGKAILWSAHLGAFEGVMRDMEPKPSVAIMAIAGRANLNGRPFDGSAAEFALMQTKWLGEPDKVIWCLHDEAPIPPYRIKTEAATKAIEEATKSRVLTMEPAKRIVLDL